MKSAYKYIAAIALVGLCSVPRESQADATVSVTPANAGAALAVALEVPVGQSVFGVEWLNNDATTPFDRLLVLEATPGTPPDLTGGASTLSQVSGPTLATGTVLLSTPASTSTGHVYVVFEVAEGDERTADGLGGGPGIGYGIQPSAPESYVSADGYDWTRLPADLRLEVSLTTGAAKGRTDALAGLPPAKAPRPEDQSDTDPLMSQTFEVSTAPNPFNPEITVRFTLRRPGLVAIRIYDVRGRLVRGLANRDFPAGAGSVAWDGRDGNKEPVASGVYVIRVESQEGTLTKAVSLVK